MAPLSTSSVLIGTTSLTNISSSRHRPPSLEVQREEGWTETWGGNGKDFANGDGDDGDGGDKATEKLEMPYLPPRYVTVMKDGCDYVGGNDTGDNATSGKLPNQDTSCMLKLSQHRVAWFEQIVLRMAYIPHSVDNSGHAAMDSTGSLPYLLDLPLQKPKSDDGEHELNSRPVLIGRNHPGGLGSYFFHQCHERSKKESSSTTNTNNVYPSWLLPSGSHIVDYLRLQHSSSMKDNLLFPEHMQGNEQSSSSGDALAYETMIREKLNYILLALRYGNDPAWEGVYRPQCIRASLNPNGEHSAGNGSSLSKGFFSLWTWYQTYSERALALYNLLPSTHAIGPSTHGGLALELFRYNDHRHSRSSKSSGGDDGGDEESSEEKNVHQHHPFSSFLPSFGGAGGGDTGKVNVYRAMEFADMYYASLESRLASSHSDSKDADGTQNDQSKAATYFLGTEKPTYIDVLLFAHLAEALCDVHLVLVLAKHSCLVNYFQWMYDQFFGEQYAKDWKSHSSGQRTDAGSVDWIRKNNIANALNAFNNIPEAHSTKQALPKKVEGQDNMVHAIKLMQKLACHCNELDEALRDAAILRTAEGEEKSVLESYHRPIGSRLYKWIMGGDVSFWGSGRSKSKRDADIGNADKDGDNDGGSQTGDEHDKEEPSSEDDEKQRMYKEHAKIVQRDRRTHDELWVSGVVVSVVAALVISASGKSRR